MLLVIKIVNNIYTKPKTREPFHFDFFLFILHIKDMESKSVSGLEVIKPEYSIRLKIKRNDWLLANTCRQAANHCPLF